MNKKQKQIIGAKIKVLYECDDHLEIATGICDGSQILFSNDIFFLLINKEDGVDRFIPVDKIAHIDVLEAKVVESETDEGNNVPYVG